MPLHDEPIKKRSNMNHHTATYNTLDPDTEARVETLLAQMTLAEKVGQLVQISPYGPFDLED